MLGFFFGGLHRRNAQLNVRGVLAVLEGMHGFDFDRPGPGRRRLSSPEQVMAAFPSVRLVVDAKEQQVQWPGGRPRSPAGRPAVGDTDGRRWGWPPPSTIRCQGRCDTGQDVGMLLPRYL